jgi:hypothetical protein
MYSKDLFLLALLSPKPHLLHQFVGRNSALQIVPQALSSLMALCLFKGALDA